MDAEKWENLSDRGFGGWEGRKEKRGVERGWKREREGVVVLGVVAEVVIVAVGRGKRGF